jgi:macrolide transport system ATP-binding/permease protein
MSIVPPPDSSSCAPLVARDLVISYGDHRVLDGISLAASPGLRLGIVGENGVGKSTLLRLLAGAEEPDSGDVRRPTGTGFLTQEPPFAATDTIASVLDTALADARTTLRRLDELATRLTEHPDALREYGDVLDHAMRTDAWDADRRATLVLDGLGLGALHRTRTLGTLSGGQRSRLALAALLARRPEALLLDEPTNHLDDQAVEFLQAHLTDLPGVVVLASHDRVFLDAVCTDICDLDPSRAGLVRYGGGYSGYLEEKRAERRRWEHAYREHQDEIARLRRSVAVTARQVAPDRPPRDGDKMGYGYHRGRVQDSVASRVRNAHRRLDEALAEQVPRPPVPLRFAARLSGPAAGDGPAITARDIEVPGRLWVHRLDLPVGGKLLVTGPNGAGKSTLLAVLAGSLRPTAGSVLRRSGTRVGLLAQDATFADPRLTAAHTYSEALGDDVVPLAELGLLAGPELRRPVGELSVGQRRRLALALLVGRSPEVLLLDEPTNHLSPALVTELEEALRVTLCTIVVATHDRLAAPSLGRRPSGAGRGSARQGRSCRLMSCAPLGCGPSLTPKWFPSS